MNLTSVLLISGSVIYTRIIKSALAELAPAAEIHSGADINAVEFLKKHSCELVIVDDEPMNFYSRYEDLHEYLRSNADLSIILMCTQKAANKIKSNARHSRRINIVVKPLDQGYDNNLMAVKQGIKRTLLPIETSVNETSSNPEEFVFVLIAASTGGPNALTRLLSDLPADLNLPVLIVQHMPSGFTENLARTLNRSCALDVSEAKDGETIRSKHVYIAPGGFHMEVTADGTISLNELELVNGVRPSADVLFSSVARNYSGKKIIACVLTGMGSDGLEGVRQLKSNCRCYCITESEESCTVYGMPRVINEAKLSDRQTTIDKAARAITRVIGTEIV